MSSSLSIKVNSVKKGVVVTEFSANCLLCADPYFFKTAPKGKPKCFNNETVFLNHLASVHKNHRLYKQYKNAIRHYRDVRKYFQPKGEKQE